MIIYNIDPELLTKGEIMLRREGECNVSSFKIFI